MKNLLKILIQINCVKIWKQLLTGCQNNNTHTFTTILRVFYNKQ